MSEPTYETTTTGGQALGKGNATLILVFGILSILCCGLLGPVAWYMGNKDLEGIAAGTIDPATEGTTKAGKILGIVGTVLLVFWLLWILFFGGMAFLGTLTGQ